ncbi:hypothetical protein ACPFP2_00800 [Micromonospora citrea]|uniref:hypothetical protein n=1 Tax=Micromonospora citrea TaxID=47855 RepID=UPI003C4A88EB
MSASRPRRRVINTAAKMETDDRNTIVHALLSPSQDIRGAVGGVINTIAGSCSDRRALDVNDVGSYDLARRYRPIRVRHTDESRSPSGDFSAQRRRFVQNQDTSGTS